MNSGPFATRSARARAENAAIQTQSGGQSLPDWLGSVDKPVGRFVFLSRISASFGVVMRRPEEDGSALKRRVDKLMCQAKQAGRAQIITDN